jgi:hypothetical protein
MFAYCANDPVNNEDPDGDIAWWIGAAVGGAAFDSAMYLLKHRRGGATWRGLGKAAAGGAITGVLFGGAGKVVSKGVRALYSARKASKIIKPKIKMNLQLHAHSNNGFKNAIRLTAKEAKTQAENLGYKKTNYISNGQPVFKKGNKYITPDVDKHNGGVWKMADSVKNLGSRKTRSGTYDKNLRRIGD